jgi:hypothetical protein
MLGVQRVAKGIGRRLATGVSVRQYIEEHELAVADAVASQ